MFYATGQVWGISDDVDQTDKSNLVLFFELNNCSGYSASPFFFFYSTPLSFFSSYLVYLGLAHTSLCNNAHVSCVQKKINSTNENSKLIKK